MNKKNKNLSLKKNFFKGVCASALIASMAVGGFSLIEKSNLSINNNISHGFSTIETENALTNLSLGAVNSELLAEGTTTQTYNLELGQTCYLQPFIQQNYVDANLEVKCFNSTGIEVLQFYNSIAKEFSPTYVDTFKITINATYTNGKQPSTQDITVNVQDSIKPTIKLNATSDTITNDTTFTEKNINSSVEPNIFPDVIIPKFIAEDGKPQNLTNTSVDFTANGLLTITAPRKNAHDVNVFKFNEQGEILDGTINTINFQEYNGAFKFVPEFRGEYTITYSAIDNRNNKAEDKVIRAHIGDTNNPEIFLSKALKEKLTNGLSTGQQNNKLVINPNANIGKESTDTDLYVIDDNGFGDTIQFVPVTISITDPDGQLLSNTDVNGKCEFTFVKVGTYTLRLEVSDAVKNKGVESTTFTVKSALHSEYENASTSLLSIEYYNGNDSDIKIAKYNTALNNFKNEVIEKNLQWNDFVNTEAEEKKTLLLEQSEALSAYRSESDKIKLIDKCTNSNKMEVEIAIHNYKDAKDALKVAYTTTYFAEFLDQDAELKLKGLENDKNSLKKVIEMPVAVNSRKTYLKGTKQGIDFLGLTEQMQFVGEYEFENACVDENHPYIVKIALKQPDVYEWSTTGSSEPLEFKFYIDKANLFVDDYACFPKIVSKTFVKNGNIFSLECPVTNYMKRYHIEASSQVNNHQREAGVYEVKFYFNITENANNYLPINEYRSGIMIIKDQNVKSANNIDVQAFNETGFHPSTRLTPTEVDSQSLNNNFSNEIKLGMKENEKIFNCYNISYYELGEDGREKTSPSHKIKIKIKLPSGMNCDNLKIVHCYNDDLFGQVVDRYLLADDTTSKDSNKNYYTIKDGYVEIDEIQDLGIFAFVGVENQQFPVWGIILIVAGSLTGLALLVFIILLILRKSGHSVGKLNESLDKILKKKNKPQDEENDNTENTIELSENDEISVQLETVEDKDESTNPQTSKKTTKKKTTNKSTKSSSNNKKSPSKQSKAKTAKVKDSSKIATKVKSSSKKTGTKTSTKKATSKTTSAKKSNTKKSSTTKKKSTK